MTEKKRVYPKAFLEYVQSITNKRAKVVIDHILDLQWDGDEIKYYDALKIIADHNKIELPEFIKQIIVDRAKRK